jgi:aspartyl-tRNA(Asn)/glutamyl-tRNA(Gln) amidotransferase subunit A
MPAIGANPVDPRIAAEVDRIARELATAGAVLETIGAPFDLDRVTAAWGTVMMTGLAWYLSSIPGWQDKVNPSAKAVAQDGTERTTGELLDALATAAAIRRAAGEFFASYDFLLCPATAALAWPADNIFPPQIDGKPVGPRGHAVFTAWMNVAGVPAVVVPLTMTKDSGGIGLQLVAGHGRDRDLLQFIESSSVFRRLPLQPLAEL